MKKTLPSIRLTEDTYRRIEKAIEKHNKKSLVKMPKQTFRRLAYELLSQMILLEKEIPIELEE